MSYDELEGHDPAAEEAIDVDSTKAAEADVKPEPLTPDDKAPTGGKSTS